MKKEMLNSEEKTRGIIPQKNNLPPESAKEISKNRALTVYVGDKLRKVFLSYGFYYHRNDYSTYHAHSYYHEVIILVGDCEFIAGDETLRLKGTNVIIMPPKVYHKLLTTENVEACAFFIDSKIDFTVKNLPEELVRGFFKEIEQGYKTNDHSIIAPYISLIVSYFLQGKNTIEPEEVDDYAFLMDTFFNLRYMDDVSLENLADYLHVSATHAHRLVQKHTGVTFTEELTLRRLKVADFLVKCRGMNLTDAAEAVGFGSYTGFWKARAKYKGRY